MNKKLFKLTFIDRDEAYELYAGKVYQADLMGFIAIEDINFRKNDTLVVDPSEERMRHEFRGVKRFFIPMHSVIRIDEVEKTGTAKITAINDKVARLHRPPVYTRKGTDKAT